MTRRAASDDATKDLRASVKRVEESRNAGGAFAEIVGAIQTAIVLTDPDLPGSPIIFANEAFLVATGYSIGEVLGRSPEFLPAAGKDAELLSQVIAALPESDCARAELTILRKDKSTFRSCLSGRAIMDGQMHLLEFFDTTERYSLMRSQAVSEQNFRLLVEGISDYAIYMLDPDGRLETWNTGAERIKGYTAEEVLGRHVSLFYTEEDRRSGAPEQMLATAQQVGRLEREGWRVRKDGSRFPAHVVIGTIRDDQGTLVGFAEVTRDVTERQRARDAEHASEAKTQFLASMSHEIRTPLNGIIGYTERLMEEHLTPDQRRYAERIQVSGSALLTIINDILDLSQIEAGRIELEEYPFSFEALVDNVVSIVSGAADAKGLSLRTDLDPDLPRLVSGDEARLRQVLLNLLNNAVKFTHRGHVQVTVKSEGQSDERVTVSVSVTDTGVGIPQDKHHRLFRRFSQVDHTIRRNYGGTGLGLAISKRLIDLMGGEIGVESKEGHGSTFWFRVSFPIASPADLASADEAADMMTMPPARILVAEDLEINQELARSILEKAGHHVDIVTDGTEALAAVTSKDYDLVLMDIQMPIMDGLTATRTIRGLNHPARDLPIIAMTANVLAQQVREYKQAGLDDHIGKPMKRTDLLKKVSQWLSGKDPAGGTVLGSTERPIRPAFDEQAFNELRELVGRERTVSSLKEIGERLKVMFGYEASQPLEREELARCSHRMVAHAGICGFYELSDACMDLETACADGRDIKAQFEKAREAGRTVLEIIPRLMK